MASLLSPSCLDRVGAALAGVAGLAGASGTPGVISIGAGILSVACSGRAALSGELSKHTNNASEQLEFFMTDLRKSWSVWSHHSSPNRQNTTDIKAAANVFELYFTNLTEIHLPSADAIVVAKLNADQLTALMLKEAASVEKRDYANTLDLQANRQFFTDVISGAFGALLARPSFSATLQPAFMRWVVSKLDDMHDDIRALRADVAKVTQANETIVSMLQTQLEKHADLSQRNGQLEAQLHGIVKALCNRQDANMPPVLVTVAIDSLARGQTVLTEHIFEEIALSFKRTGPEAIQKAAALRRKGALAFLHDMQKAISSFEQAVDVWPADIDAWNYLGHVYLQVGELNKSKQAFQKVKTLAANQTDPESWQAIADKGLNKTDQELHLIEPADVQFDMQALLEDDSLGRSMTKTVTKLTVTPKTKIEREFKNENDK